MIKRTLIILAFIFKLFPGQDKNDVVYAQYGEEFPDWGECWFVCNEDYPVDTFDWGAIQDLQDQVNEQNWEENQQWIDDMNNQIDDWISEGDATWADFYGDDANTNYYDWLDYWEIINNYNNGQGNPPGPDDYYTTINYDNDTYKYKYGDTIYVPQRVNKTVKLTIHKGSTSPNSSNSEWLYNSVTNCTNIGNCNFSVTNIGTSSVTWWDHITNSLPVHNIIKVYQMPTFVFKRGENYNGEYGFDDYDSTFRKSNIQTAYPAGYEIIQINEDGAYKVPWMSLLDQQSAIIKDTLFNLSNDAKKDVDAFVELRPSNSNILIDGMPSKKFDYATLGIAHMLPISATQWDNNILDDANKAIESIYAITNTGDTIGKLHLSAYRPQKKKVVIVYVNTGTGYNTLSKTDILNQLNTNSHNQLMRKWQINNSYSDTLDVTAEFNANPSLFHNKDTVPKIFRNYYFQHKAIDISNNVINFNVLNKDSDRVYVAFVANYSLIDSLTIGGILHTQSTDGSTISLGGNYTALFNTGTLPTKSHEFGHMLHLDHTWLPPLFIASTSTTNFMDYLPTNGSERRNSFYFCQWKIVY